MLTSLTYLHTHKAGADFESQFHDICAAMEAYLSEAMSPIASALE